MTPLVRKLAAEAGVDLATVKGTGVGGRIRRQDIEARTPRRPAPAAAAQAVPRHTLVQTVLSQWPAWGYVKIDAYSSNPLVEDLQQSAPQLYEQALQLESAPTLFPTGDLPLFTASGIDPRLLMTLPTRVRHLAASVNQMKASEIFEKCSGGDLAAVSQAAYLAGEIASPGWGGYVARVEAWRWAIPPAPEYKVVYYDGLTQAGPRLGESTTGGDTSVFR